jgi:hypothetical protein
MAFSETVLNRKVLQGILPFKVTLAEPVYAGDPLGISSNTWVLSAHADAEEPIAIAGRKGIAGETITAFLMAAVEFTHTSGNVPTDGGKIAVHDSGYYVVAGSGLPDVGYITSVASDSLTSVGVMCPIAPQLTTART